jgi:hypothetical protein
MADMLSSVLGSALTKLGLTGATGALSGQLMKAGLQVTEGEDAGKLLEFHFNPETITVGKDVKYQEQNTQGSNSGEKEFVYGASRTMKIASVYFDTFESRKNVRSEFIDMFEKMSHYDKTLHRPPRVLFVWGNFNVKSDPYNACKWYVRKVNITYVMFLSDGTPVRAKVDFELLEATTTKEAKELSEKQSPDHAKVVTVQRGDTLQAIAFREYDNPSEWRRIAEANSVDDPMSIEPGTKLLVPPILK